MFDAKALLNSLLGAKGATAVTDALENARSAASGAADRAQAQLQGTKAGEAFGEARQYASEHPGRTLAGAGALTALLLGTGVAGENALESSQRILRQVGGLDRLASAGLGSLTAVAGLGDAKAARILAAIELGLRVVERAIPLDRWADMSELMVTSTGPDIAAVTSVDGRTVGDGAVGPVAQRLLAAFRGAWAREDRETAAARLAAAGLAIDAAILESTE